MKENEIRQRITEALDAEWRCLEPTGQQKQRMYETITGGTPMRKKTRISLAFAIMIALLILAIGAAAAVLLSAREVIEQQALPMAMENDTDARRVESYTHEQLVALVKAAHENGIDLDETSGIMRAFRTGEGYWEDEAIMEICREAFGGTIEEWAYQDKYWFLNLMSQMNHTEEDFDMPYPGEGDLTAEEARAIADEAVISAYPGAADIHHPDAYLRKENFYSWEGEKVQGSLWKFDYKPLDLHHAWYSASVDNKGQVTETLETPQDWSHYTVSQLDYAVNEAYRSLTYTKSSWSPAAWHAFRDMLPGAEKQEGWNIEYDGYLACGYPLPDPEDMGQREALAAALADTGMAEADMRTYEAVLLADASGRHIWKITLQKTGSIYTPSKTSLEIDARDGSILHRETWQLGDMNWQAYVFTSVYRDLTADMLRGEEAQRLAADALRRELDEAGIPYEDPELFIPWVNYSAWTQRWDVTFRTKTVAYASGSVQITEPDHTVTVTSCQASQVDGDTLWDRYRQVYNASRWQQETWVKFGKDMRQYEPKGWIGRLLKQTEYLEESAVSMTRAQAVDIAFANNDWKEEKELDATLIAADPHPVWKVVLSGRECIWLYEIDTETGEVLDKEKYAPDNYEFDHPVKRYTLHRVFAPVYAAEFGLERLAVIEISKAFGDMTFDDPIATVLGEDMDSESMSGEIVSYTAEVDGRTVTIRPDRKELPAYRVTFTENDLTESCEILPQE